MIDVPYEDAADVSEVAKEILAAPNDLDRDTGRHWFLEVLSRSKRIVSRRRVWEERQS